MMTGEAICGIESVASILYFKDRVTFPDNTHMPLRLRILPVPHFSDGEALAIQRGSGLCVPKSTEKKEKAAAVFAEWLTEEEHNLPFVMTAGYLPVKSAAYERIRDPKNIVSPTPNAVELYNTVNRIRDNYRFWVPPYFDGYGELEKKFCEEQMKLFARYREACAGKPVSQNILDAMFKEFRAVME
ncbi:MAG: extracellular solute-binding protein [Mailhella sp.]|nr:extracellular solute-binding protein [Mailhella sp.]